MVRARRNRNLKSKALIKLENSCKKSESYQTSKDILSHSQNKNNIKVQTFKNCQNRLKCSDLNASHARATQYNLRLSNYNSLNQII